MAIERVRRLGVYAPLSATYYQDDDIAEAGEAAELLYVRALAFCAGRPSDGFISDTQVVRFVGVGMGDALDRAETLVKVGLWDRVDGGFVVRSWLKWNKSAEELGQDRTRDRDRKRKQSEERADRELDDAAAAESTGRIPPATDALGGADSADPSEQSPNGILEVSARNPQESLPNTLHSTSLHDTTHSHPPGKPADDDDEPIPPEIAAEAFELADMFPGVSINVAKGKPPPASGDELFDQFWAAYPRSVDKGHARRAWATALKKPGVDAEAIVAAAQAYRDDPKRPREAKYIPYPSTWLNGERWTDSPNVAPPPRDPHSNPWDN